MRGKVAAARARLRDRHELVLEILAFRHQLAVMRRTGTRRPRFLLFDRLFLVFLSRRWSGWRSSLIIVQPETVLRWRRQGWSMLRRFGRRRRWHGGRPRIAVKIRQLIIRMSLENFLWGAPRIHGELLKLGYDVSQPRCHVTCRDRAADRKPGGPSCEIKPLASAWQNHSQRGR